MLKVRRVKVFLPNLEEKSDVYLTDTQSGRSIKFQMDPTQAKDFAPAMRRWFRRRNVRSFEVQPD